jgi:flagellin
MFGNLTTINSNFGAMEALYNLKKTNGSLSFHQTRLSTGKRINSAEDDAAGYHIAKHLESRRRGLSQALDNVSTAKNVLNIAEGGYQSQMDILQQIKESLTQAADGALSEEQRHAIGDRIDALLTEVDDINNQTKYNGFVLFSTDTSDSTSGVDRSMQFQVGEETSDTFTTEFDNSNRANMGENNVNVDSIVANGWGSLTQDEATDGINTLETAIDSLSATIQRMGDYQARFTSKEESLSISIANTEASRSRIEDADFAKEQMEMVKLQILQQTGVSAFSQANSAPQVVLSLFK